MKISSYIAKLQQIKKEHGDLKIIHLSSFTNLISEITEPDVKYLYYKKSEEDNPFPLHRRPILWYEGFKKENKGEKIVLI